MREIGLSDVRLASPPCFPLSWETDNVSVHLSADYPVIWHQCHSLSQHNTPLGPLVLAWAIYGLSSSPNCKNILSSLFHRLLSISTSFPFFLFEKHTVLKIYIYFPLFSDIIIKFAFMLKTRVASFPVYERVFENTLWCIVFSSSTGILHWF